MSEKVVFNGVSAHGGAYLVPPVGVDELAQRILRLDRAGGDLAYLRGLEERRSDPRLGCGPGVLPQDPTQAGWGVVFAVGESSEVRAQVMRLVEHRGARVRKGCTHVLSYDGTTDWTMWLRGNGVDVGSCEPTKVPYYLLLVGDPARIPFTFSQPLSNEYCVGRIDFPDASGYARYVDSVIRHEEGGVARRSSEVCFFGTRHDEATTLSADYLVAPLAAVADGYRSRLVAPSDSTKQAFLDLLHSEPATAPSVLFTATHGLGFESDDPEQPKMQGALVCADWPGGNHDCEPKHCVAADDIGDAANVHGLVAFHFACYSVGTPDFDQYRLHQAGVRERIAERPFFSALPQRLLSHPKGGALACIGHIDAALACSIVPASTQAHITPFRHALGWLMSGAPVGFAVQDFRARYASASIRLTELQKNALAKIPVQQSEIVYQWLLRNDAEGYVVFGDPAVRLAEPA